MKSDLPAAPYKTSWRAERGSGLVIVACAWLVAAGPAHAYVGPGAGLSAIGIVVGLIGAVFLGIIGFIWYPIKRLLRMRRERAETPQAETAAGEPPAKEP